MADTITLTFDTPKASRVGGTGAFGLVSGSASLTSYDTSKTALAALLAYFVPSTGLLRVSTNGVSSNGYAIRWDHTAQAFRAYTTGSALSGVLAEAAAAANIGTFDFIAFGQMAG